MGVVSAVAVGGGGEAVGGVGGDEPVAFGVGQVDPGVPEAGGDGLGELASVDGGAGALVDGDELLLAGVVALSRGVGGEGSADSLLGGSDEVVLVGLLSSWPGVVVAAGGEGGGELAASACSDRSRCSGRSLPRRPARRRMPRAAFLLKKNLGAHSATSTSAKDVHTPPSLGYSEVSAVQDSPGEIVKPELGQRREKDGEISAVVAGKESGNVLDE